MSSAPSTRVLRGTQSLCPECLATMPGTIEEFDDSIWLRKACSTHGSFLIRLSRDPLYTRRCLEEADAMVPPSKPMHAGAVIVELTDDCNLPCAICIAGSAPGGQRFASVADVHSSIEDAIASQGTIPILMLSGGEPTIHPLFREIVAAVYEHPQVEHLIVISNGKRFAEDRSFAREIADKFPRLEIYLQFDSLSPNVLKAIRGMDLSEMRKAALDALAEYSIPTTLVSVVNNRINISELGSIVDLGLSTRNIRGVTFQPIRATGRHQIFDYERDGTSLTDVRTAILEQTRVVRLNDLAPHPTAPESISLAYWRRDEQKEVTHESLEQMKSSDVVPLFLSDERLFRVAVVCLYDAFNFCRQAAERAIVQFAPGDGRLVPLDTYYLEEAGPSGTSLEEPTIRAS